MIALASPAAQFQTWRIALAVAIGAAVLLLAQWSPPGAAIPALPVPTPAQLSGERATGGVPPASKASVDPLLGADGARLSNAQVPFAAQAVEPAPPFRFEGDEASRLRARDCLAAAAFYEAGDDPRGQRAVAQVVLNRVRHAAFPKSVCAVVFQGAERRTGCQFTFTCDGALARRPTNRALARARAVAQAALLGAVYPQVGLSTHYHADYVVPYWRDSLVKVAREGAHLFYRWPGYWGSNAAFRREIEPPVEAPVPALLTFGRDAAEADITKELASETPPPPAIDTPLARTPARDALELHLDPDALPGSFALRALTLCGQRRDCKVAGTLAQEMAFLYVRGPGGEGAYWDCGRYQRADANQCLPKGAALERLLAS